MACSLKNLTEYSSLILAIITLVLVLITACYLLETRQIRKIAEKSLTLEFSPDVFLEDMQFLSRLDEGKKSIVITAVLKVKNIGKAEAKDFELNINTAMGEGSIKKKVGPFPHLLPTQLAPIAEKIFELTLNDTNFPIVKRAIEEKKALIIPEKMVPPIFINLNIKYFDQNAKEHNRDYKIKYTFHNNTWTYILDDNAENDST